MLRNLCASSFFLFLQTKASEAAESQTTTMAAGIRNALSEFVVLNVRENGAYKNISEYVCGLIQRDKERAERAAFDRLNVDLNRAFAAPEASYKPLTSSKVSPEPGLTGWPCAFRKPRLCGLTRYKTSPVTVGAKYRQISTSQTCSQLSTGSRDTAWHRGRSRLSLAWRARIYGMSIISSTGGGFRMAT